MQLARAVRNRTTGVLYVLDEPSIGLHPANVEGLKAVMHDLVADGNTVLLVDHDVDILREADRIIEMGLKAGREGGRVIAEGSVGEIEANSDSMIGPISSGETRGREDEDAARQSFSSMAKSCLRRRRSIRSNL